MEHLYISGKEYWAILKRFHAHRDQPLMKRVAVRDMRALLGKPSMPAGVRRRINEFIERNRPHSPGNDGGNDGPRYA